MIIDFMPLYIHCGMSFSSNYYFHSIKSKYDKITMENPILRFEMEKKQALFIRKKYPTFFGIQDIDELDKIYKSHPSLGIGVATVPKCWGCEVKYEDHMNPFALPLLQPNEDPLSLKEPDLDSTMQWLFEEYDKFQEIGYSGSSVGLPDLQGPLNVSMKLVGDKRMLSLIARRNKTDAVEHILDVASNVYIDVMKRLRNLTKRPEKSNWSVSGCTYYYINPTQWVKYILPVIKKCQTALGDGVRLHHCGEADSEKIRTYFQFQWNDLEFGFGSDLKLARQFSDHPKLGPLPISCRISPYRMLNQTAEQIRKDVEWIIDGAKGGPMSINVVGVPHNTPEENLWSLWNAVQDYNNKKAEEMDDED